MVEKTCSQCGGLFSVHKYRAETAMYCSRPCQHSSLVGRQSRRSAGGRITNKHGYVLVRGSEITSGWSYRYEHRVIIEAAIGRRLSRDEVVHHIDMNKKNNHINNLFLTDRIKHRGLHQQMELLVVELMKSGLVKFKDGKYIFGQSVDAKSQ